MKFYVGLHMPQHAFRFERCMISINQIRKRKSDFAVNEWMLDSGAFTEISKYGEYRNEPEEYAEHIVRWSKCGNMVSATSQDYMCEPFILSKTGKTVEQHQCLTIDRYTRILKQVAGRAYVMPVIQGYQPEEYLRHIDMYGDLLQQGAWVGVGSVCKRNSSVKSIEQVLVPIVRKRPDLLLHGFGVKTTSLRSGLVRSCLHSSDSMAWSFAARMSGGNAHDWMEAKKFSDKINEQIYYSKCYQETMF